jgi:GGDEF domain-containing protein
MQTTELVIWSAMFGGLAALASFAMIDALVRRSVASWRAFVFVTLTGTACVLLTGLPMAVFPDAPSLLMHMLQNSLGLLSGALTLTYLGSWLGVTAADRLVRLTIWLGAVSLVLCACLLATLTLLSTPEQWHDLLTMTATVNGLAVLLPLVIAIRAIALGDRLAWGFVFASGLLGFMVAGLYARGLQVSGLGPTMWATTAVCTVGFFMLGTYLGLRRDRVNRHLERLANLAQGADPATGLPKGSVLLSKLDDAIWRSARMNQECTVICLRLQNLYELSEIVGHHSDKQILSAMSARIRRAIGFRHMLGLYHPQCFVVVMSTYSNTRLVEKSLQRLRYLMAKPLTVVGLDDATHSFLPHMGIGSVLITAENCDPATVLDQAERLSLKSQPPVDDPSAPTEQAVLTF